MFTYKTSDYFTCTRPFVSSRSNDTKPYMPQQSVRTEVNACKTLERTEKNPLCHLNKFITFMLNRSRFGYIHNDGLFHVKHAIRFNEQTDETEAYVTSIAFATKRQLAEFISRTAHLTPSFGPHIVRLHTYSSVLTSTKCHCQAKNFVHALCN